MKLEDLLAVVGDQPIFESALLFAGDVDRRDVVRQLARWHAAGKLTQLRRGVYALAPPYRRVAPHPFLVANRLARPSYVSTESALAHHGLIPEHVAAATSVTTGRPTVLSTPLGRFEFRNVSRRLFWGYEEAQVAPGQRAFVARAEKALLDLAHLRTGADMAFARGLRLQNLDQLDLDLLRSMGERTESPKLRRFAALIAELASEEAQDYEDL